MQVTENNLDIDRLLTMVSQQRAHESISRSLSGDVQQARDDKRRAETQLRVAKENAHYFQSREREEPAEVQKALATAVRQVELASRSMDDLIAKRQRASEASAVGRTLLTNMNTQLVKHGVRLDILGDFA
ncbi:hypothetical protein ACUNV4_10360 [Granulosicoccus sp. 3-233]|uniref:hypothetical protein n=1 Tax=Granulosicoccus sp. 3-233 TaxID=3417969 RepID=UPI003D34CF9B